MGCSYSSCFLRFAAGQSASQEIEPNVKRGAQGNASSTKEERTPKHAAWPACSGGGLLDTAIGDGSLRNADSAPTPTRLRGILERLTGREQHSTDGREKNSADGGVDEGQSPGDGESVSSEEERGYPVPSNEKLRQATVDMLGVVHTSQDDPHFKAITDLMGKMFDCPLAGITIIDHDRIWCKSVYCPGLPIWTEHPRRFTYANYLLLTGKHEVLVVEDALKDARFSDQYHYRKGSVDRVRFFAAAPLIAPNGHVIGTMAIADPNPRTMDASVYPMIANLAEIAVRRILQEASHVDPSVLPAPSEAFANSKVLLSSTASGRESLERSVQASHKLAASDNHRLSSDGARRMSLEVSVPGTKKMLRRLASNKTNSAKVRARAAGVPDVGVMICGATESAGQVLFVDANWERICGVAPPAACSSSLWRLFRLADKAEATEEGLHEAVLSQLDLEVDAWQEGGQGTPVRLSLRRATGKLDQYAPLVGIPSFVEYSRNQGVRHFLVLVTRRMEALPRSTSKPADSDPPDPSASLGSQGPNPFAMGGPNPFAAIVSAAPGPLATGSTSPFMRSSTPPICESPMKAFAAAAGEEAWGSRPQAGSRELNSGSPSLIPIHSIPSSFRSRTSQPLPSQPLPYNSNVFNDLSLGPLLGRGAYGEVYRGVWRGMEKKVAVKIVDTYHEGSLGPMVEGLAEATLMEEIEHPNIMKTYAHATRFKQLTSYSSTPSLAHAADSQSSGSSVLETWLLLEYCNKGSLQGAIERGWFKTEPSRKSGKPALGPILATALELAEAMQYLHSRGIVHGDLTPANVLLSDKDTAPHGFTVKVADFGLSRDVEGTTVNTGTLGTVTHMPPELLEWGELTKSADVYSFGVLLWSMYAGVPAWEGLRRTQVIYQITTLLKSLAIPSDCPPPFKAVMKRCLSRDRRERPTFAVLVKELHRMYSLHQRGMPLDDSPFTLGIARVSAPYPEEKRGQTHKVSKKDFSRSKSSRV